MNKNPHILHQDIQEDTARLQLIVPDDLVYLRGHFNNHPILPGVVQLNWAATLSTQCFHLSGHFKNIEALKFQKLLLPQQTVTLTLKLDALKQKIHFEYASDDKTYSSGRLVIE